MTCANWMLSVLALIIFGAAVWPGIGGGTSGITTWIMALAATVLLVLAWTNVECKRCQTAESKA